MNNKKILLHLIILFSGLNSIAQTSYQKGFIRGTSSDNTSITGMEFDNYGGHVIFGKFYDSVQVNPFASSPSLLGGSSSTGVHNAFFAIYDQSSVYMFAHKFGNATDSVSITSAAFDNSGNLVLGGTFKGTVDFADNAGSPYFLTSTGAGSDAFIAHFDNFGNFMYAAMLESNGSRAIVNDVIYNDVFQIVVVGHFTGTVDLDPSATDTTFTANGTDGFIATFDYSLNYVSSTVFNGIGNQIPTHLRMDYDNPVVGGLFDNQIDMDLSGGNNIITSNGGTDVFLAYMGVSYSITDSITIGGSGNEKLKDFLFSTSEGYYVIMDFEQTTEFDANFGSTTLTSNGQSDVAIVRYYNNFQLGSAKQFGNANGDKGYRIVKNEASGGRSAFADNDFIFTMGYSGTVDFNPDLSETSFSTSTNTPMNSAVVNLDSAGTYLFHGSIEAESILGYKGFGFYGNDMIMAGNFAGTDVDMLVYDDTSSLSHNGVRAGFYETYDRCNMVATAPYMTEAFECGTCSAKLSIQVISGAVQPIDYSWQNGDLNYEGETVTGVCPDNAGHYNIYITDFYGCQVYDTLWVRTHPDSLKLDAIINVTPTSCGNNLGFADVTPVNSWGTNSYLWSTGSTSSTADSLVSGNYFVQVIDDSLFCYVEKTFFVDNSNGPVITINSSSDPACGGVNDGNIDVTVTGGASPYTFLWTNGATTEDLSGVGGGTYTLIVTDNAGCENSVCVTLYQPSEMYTYTTNNFYSNCLTADGILTVETYGGYTPYTYQWDANAGSSTNDTVNNLFAGMYSVVVTDSLGCSKTFEFGVSDFQGPYVTYNYINNPSCTGTLGFIDVYSYAYSPLGLMTYQWNTGETVEDINVESGVHLLEVTDDAFCKAVGMFWIDQILPMSPTICMVTVDSTGTQNVVVWDKSTTTEAAYYNIYREGFCNQNDFGIIGNVAYDSLSVFYDTVVNSDTRTWKYYVTAVDTCGFESGPSEIHRTIHLSAALDADTNIVLDWSDYVGQEILGYKIYRRQPTGLLYDYVDSVCNTQTSYLDTIDFSLYTEEEYYIEAIPANVCNATRAYNQNEARSNHSRITAPVDTTSSTVDLPESISETAVINLFPNPSNDLLNLVINGNKDAWRIEMIDYIGRVVMTGTVQQRAAFTTKDIPAGVYFIRLTSTGNEVQTLKLLIAH